MGPRPVGGEPVSFAEHFAASDQFDLIFKHGMALVERTAAYLDGAGRMESKALGPPSTMVYATESMRLTTRLLELASWLLIRRAVREGEITREEAQRKRQKLKLQRLTRPSHIRNFTDLPATLRLLIEESINLADRVSQLDKAIETPSTKAALAPTNPVAAQLALLRDAFGTGARRAG